ncbi:MAG: EFR1 family ferrodoxin [Methanomicrobiaceae archaeon]|nr:EFR1 family ferrodoxin [Methanomicrobiaceae archaeon]
MKVLVVFFSATKNTAEIAGVVERKMGESGADVEMLDITPYYVRNEITDLKPFDAVVFGMPVHSWRAPRVVRDWMATLDGHGKKCSMFFTYGGFGIHPAHYSTGKILEDRGFCVVSSAEFPASHTFNIGGWKAMENRPDTRDFLVAEEYAEKTYRRFLGEDNGLPEDFEKTEYTDDFLSEIEKFRFRILTKLPFREYNACSMCRICEDICPAGAMNADLGKADPEKCIACLGCVAACPEGVLRINDMSESWSYKLDMENISPADMDKKVSRIYL